MLYLVYAESANYCGYGQHFVVEAKDETEAEALVADAVEEYFYEQDDSQLQEEEVDVDVYGSIQRIEEFGPQHEQWEFYQNPSQEEFYHKVNV